MKIALVWYGQMRQFDKCFGAWVSFINRYDPDIFIHTWSDFNLPYNINITSALIERPKDFTSLHPGVHEYSSSAINVLPQMYSITKSDRLRIDHELSNKFHYDYVVRSRFDISLYDPSAINLGSMPPKRYHVCSNHWGNIQGMFDDNLMVSSSPNMEYISSNIFDYALYNIRKDKVIPSGEQLMGRFFRERDLMKDLDKNPQLNFVLGRNL